MESASDAFGNEIDLDLAGAGARLGARLIDAIIGVGISITLFFIVAAGNDLDLSDPDINIADEIGDGAALVLRWVPALAWFVYEAFLTKSRGQTVGKMVTRIKVINVVDGETPDWGPAAIRWAVLALPMVLLPDLIGIAASLLIGLWYLWDRKRQGLHDKAANTYVVKVPAARPAA